MHREKEGDASRDGASDIEDFVCGLSGGGWAQIPVCTVPVSVCTRQGG